METHSVSVRTYVIIYALLMFLLLVTVGAAYIDLGALNIVVAMAIAVTKAALVIIFFMHVKYSPKLIWLFAGLGFAWIILLLAFPFADIWTRSWPS
jgi:cytochrome c oxidase subunit 4